MPVTSGSLAAPDAPPRPALRRLRRRAEFLRAARGYRIGGREFALQAAPVGDPVPGVGFTVTKKVGNAPERNRIKRRLRAVAATCAGDFSPQFDYVMIGRREALAAPFAKLVDRLRASLKRAHAEAAADRGTRERRAGHERAGTERAMRP